MPTTRSGRTTSSAVSKPKAKPNLKSNQAPKSGSSNGPFAAKAASEKRRERKLAQVEKIVARREWTEQYLQGKRHTDFPGLGCGHCTLISPKIDYLSPFKDRGSIEVQTGVGGPKDGSFRICRDNGEGPIDSDIFLVPFENIEQVIVISDDLSVDESDLRLYKQSQSIDDESDSKMDLERDQGQNLAAKSDGDAVLQIDENDLWKRDGTFRVIVIPTASTGASGTREEPQWILFKWPMRKADKKLEGKIGRESQQNNKTYLSVLETVFNQRLEAFGKKVIVLDEKAKPAADPSFFRCTAQISSDLMSMAAKVEGKVGSLCFLPTGILWLSRIIYYLPFNAFDTIQLLFIKDVASKCEKKTEPIVAMAVMTMTTEPFYEGKKDNLREKLFTFVGIKDHRSVRDRILKYAKAHNTKVEKLQIRYMDYAKNMPLTGFEDLVDSEDE